MTAVPFSRPFFSGNEEAALAEVIASGWVTQGPRVQAFETAFARRVGAGHAVAVTNCTSALHLALVVSGVGAGDEVIVPSLSFVATANAVRQCGAQPVFADVDSATYNLNPAAAAAAVTKRTRAIMPVHQIGLPADMDEFGALAETHGLVIVEDAAMALGATYRGRAVGSLETLACFSFHPRKVLTTGEGGMITTPDAATADRLRRLRHHGMSVSDLERHGSEEVRFESYLEVGYNCRMTDLQAALGLCQLEVLDEALAARRRLARRYDDAVESWPHVEGPHEPDDRVHSFQSYAIRLTDSAPVSRDDLMQLLLVDGIATRRGVTAIHQEPAYAAPGVTLPATEAAAREALLLPLYPQMRDDDQDYVVERLDHHLAQTVSTTVRA
jgi:dTDP-4-amino-4,6-dideoxygalactose transaminase